MSIQEKIRAALFSMIDLIDTCAEEELLFKPTPDSWNILECIEHICLVNSNVVRILKVPEPSTVENKSSELYGESKLNHLLVTKRELKRIAPEFVAPKGAYKTAAEAKKVIYEDTECLLQI